MKEFSFIKSLGAEKEPLSQQLILYIPNKDKQGRTIKNFDYWVKDARKILTMIGGGATTMPPADGSWIDPVKNIDDITKLHYSDIVWEKTTLIYVYIDPDRFEKYLPELRKFLHKFGRETNQGEVVFEFDGAFYKIHKYDK